MYSEEDSRVLIERSESVLRKSRVIQQKADEATKHFYKVLKANDALIARLTAGAIYPPIRIHQHPVLHLKNQP